jgi:hypothetical protein
MVFPMILTVAHVAFGDTWNRIVARLPHALGDLGSVDARQGSIKKQPLFGANDDGLLMVY